MEERKQKGARVDEIARILETTTSCATIVVRELRTHRDALRRAAPHDARRRGAARRGARRQARHDGRRAAAHRHLGLLDGTGVCAAWPRATRMDGFPVELAAPATGRWRRLRRTRRPSSTPSPPTARVPRAGGRAADVGAPVEGRARRRRGPRRQVAALVPLEPEGGFLLLVTARGEVKRVEAPVYASATRRGRPRTTCPTATASSPSCRTARAPTRSCTRRAGRPAHRPGPAAAGEEPGRGRRRRDAARRRRRGRRGDAGARRRPAAGRARGRAREGGARRALPGQGTRHGRGAERLDRHAAPRAGRPWPPPAPWRRRTTPWCCRCQVRSPRSPAGSLESRRPRRGLPPARPARRRRRDRGGAGSAPAARRGGSPLPAAEPSDAPPGD